MIRSCLQYVSLVVLLLLMTTGGAAAENGGTSKRFTTEQLLNQLRSMKNPSLYPAVPGESFRDVKCGFGIQAQIVNRWKEFSPAQRTELSLLMKANVMQSDTVVGHFHIHYDTSGINEPALLDHNNQRIPGSAKIYIQYVAQIFNHVWDVEVDQMGYAAPPFESGQSYYNIYVTSQPDEYGSTTPIQPQLNGFDVPPRYASSITIDNDYKGFASSGIEGLEVTAAHEFHHAIQVGSYGFWENDLYIHELTSTWFEDVVYTDVNDYYNYLPDYFYQFSNGLSFNSKMYGGYERCIFAHCLAKMYGADIMKDIWTRMSVHPFLESTEAVMEIRGSSLQAAFAEFTKWNYYTWDRADTVKYYPEGNHYPRFKPLQKIEFYNTSTTVSGTVQALSSSMFEFDLPHDTITAVMTNVDVGSAMSRETTQVKIDVTLSTQSLSPPYQEFGNGLKAKIAVDTLSLWRSLFLQSSTGTVVARSQSDAAPNPFRLAEAQNLFLPMDEDKASWADVYIYNSAYRLTYSGQLQTSYYESGGTRVIAVPASAIKSKLTSGIYFILAKTVNRTYTWKVAVIR